MITVWNRAELIITYDMQKQAEIVQILSQNHIEFRIKTTNLRNASAFASGSRGRTGTLGENQKVAYEYKIYVKKGDKDQALYLINKIH